MNKALNTLGLCKRANRLVSGETNVLDKIRSLEAKLVLLANDAGPNTVKKITDKSSFYKVKLIQIFSTEELSKAIGKRNRKTIAITDKAFADLLIKNI